MDGWVGGWVGGWLVAVVLVHDLDGGVFFDVAYVVGLEVELVVDVFARGWYPLSLPMISMAASFSMLYLL